MRAQGMRRDTSTKHLINIGPMIYRLGGRIPNPDKFSNLSPKCLYQSPDKWVQHHKMCESKCQQWVIPRSKSLPESWHLTKAQSSKSVAFVTPLLRKNLPNFSTNQICKLQTMYVQYTTKYNLMSVVDFVNNTEFLSFASCYQTMDNIILNDKEEDMQLRRVLNFIWFFDYFFSLFSAIFHARIPTKHCIQTPL
jgi:hypothetical protein